MRAQLDQASPRNRKINPRTPAASLYAVLFAGALFSVHAVPAQISAQVMLSSGTIRVFEPLAVALILDNTTVTTYAVKLSPYSLEIHYQDPGGAWQDLNAWSGTAARPSDVQTPGIDESFQQGEKLVREFLYPDENLLSEPRVYRLRFVTKVKNTTTKAWESVESPWVHLSVVEDHYNRALFDGTPDGDWLLQQYYLPWKLPRMSALELDEQRLDGLLQTPQVSARVRDFLNILRAEKYYADSKDVTTIAAEDAKLTASTNAAATVVQTRYGSPTGSLYLRAHYIQVRTSWFSANSPAECDVATQSFDNLKTLFPLGFEAHPYDDYRGLRKFLR